MAGGLAQPVVGLGATVALLSAARSGTPQRAGWLLLSAGAFLWSLADLVWALVDTGHPSVADWAYLVGYVALRAGVFGLTARRDAGRLLDMSVVVLAINLWYLVAFDPVVARLDRLEPSGEAL